MFDSLFGWRKASKCKKLIRRVQCRLKLLQNKQHAIVRQSREDVAELIKDGYEECAFNRVGQLIVDESLLTVYELLDHFCELILLQFSYIRRHKDCPNDIGEAVSSLIYASARFGDLPELRTIRELFGERYGQNFVVSGVELLPGNLVNSQIKENFQIKSIPYELKYRVVDEIARNCCLHPGNLALEDYPRWQRLKITEDPGSKVNPSTEEDEGRKLMYSGSQLTDVSAHGPCIQQLHSDSVNPPEDAEDTDNLTRVRASYNFTVCASREMEQDVVPSCADTVSCSKGTVVCLDDIEEVIPSIEKDGGFQDQRLFKFLSPASYACILRQLLLAKCCYCNFWRREPNDEMELVNYHRKLKGRNAETCNVRHHALTGTEYNQTEKHNKETKEEKISNGVVSAIASDVTSRAARTERQAPYLKAMTLPPEQSKESRKKDMSRTHSCPIQYPNHVHPKLPEYDDIAPKFVALKKAHQQCNQQYHQAERAYINPPPMS